MPSSGSEFRHTCSSQLPELQNAGLTNTKCRFQSEQKSLQSASSSEGNVNVNAKLPSFLAAFFFLAVFVLFLY